MVMAALQQVAVLLGIAAVSIAVALVIVHRLTDRAYRTGYQDGRDDECREQDPSLVAMIQATATPPRPPRRAPRPAHPARLAGDARTEVLPRIGSEAPIKVLRIPPPGGWR